MTTSSRDEIPDYAERARPLGRRLYVGQKDMRSWIDQMAERGKAAA